MAFHKGEGRKVDISAEAENFGSVQRKNWHAKCHKTWSLIQHFVRYVNITNEYEGFLAGLRITADLGDKKLIVRVDSQLVVRQINKDY